MTIRFLARLLGSALLCLVWPALVGGLSFGGGGMRGTVFYSWFILVLYGWWVYLPVMGLHQWILRCLPQPTLRHSIGVGLVLAGLVPGTLMLNEYYSLLLIPSIPSFSVDWTLDLINYAIAGVLYGGLVWHWVRQVLLRS
jgi:hypothetical protein